MTGDVLMIKYDKIIKALEQKQNRTPKEESGLMELKRLEGIIKEISEKMESLSAKPTDKVSDECRSLALEISKYSRMEKSILRNLGLVEQPRRAVYTPLTQEEIEERRKMQEEEIKRRKEEEQRRMLEKEFEDWKRKKESGELEFEEYRMRKQFMQIVVQQQEEILQAIKSGLANTQSAIKDNAEQTARAEAWYQTRRENYKIQDEMLREFFRK